MSTLNVLGFDETTGHEKIWTTGDVINGQFWSRDDMNQNLYPTIDGDDILLATGNSIHMGVGSYLTDTISVVMYPYEKKLLNNSPTDVSLDWGSRILYGADGITPSSNWGSRILLQTDGMTDALDWTGVINTSSAISFSGQNATFNSIILSQVGANSLDTNNRIAYDGSTPSWDWHLRLGYAADGTTKIFDYNNSGYNSSSAISFDSQAAIFTNAIKDSSNFDSINTNTRLLIGSDGAYQAVDFTGAFNSGATLSFYIGNAVFSTPLLDISLKTTIDPSLRTLSDENGVPNVAWNTNSALRSFFVDGASNNDAIYAIGTDPNTSSSQMLAEFINRADGVAAKFYHAHIGTIVNLSSSNNAIYATDSGGRTVTIADGTYAINVTGAINAIGTITTGGGNVIGANFSQTLQAQTDGDSLVGVSISPTFDDNTHTGLTKYALRVSGNGQFFGAAGESIAIASLGVAINATGGNLAGGGGAAGAFSDYNFNFNANLAQNDGMGSGFAGSFYDSDGNSVTIADGTYALNTFGPINTDQAGSSPGLAGGVPTFTDYYGGNTNALGDPLGWLTIFVEGNERRIAYYAAP